MNGRCTTDDDSPRETTERDSRFTLEQETAICATGNLLVAAGAGTGKTRTLIGRCLRLIEEDRTSIDRILMVTFTDAAAGEMRDRIRRELRAKAAEQPENAFLSRQVALLDTARICTMHSFCLQLVREHFHQLELDPQFGVLDERQTGPLMRAALDETLERHYAGNDAAARATQELVRSIGHGTDRDIRTLVLAIHRFSQALPDPSGWLDWQERYFAEAEPGRWREWFEAAFHDWCDRWRELVGRLAGEAPAVKQCDDILRKIAKQSSRENIAAVLREIEAADNGEESWPRGTKGRVRDQLKQFFNDAAFLGGLLPDESGNDPLQQDWDFARGHMTALIGLAREFALVFGKFKRELGGVDFPDLEQNALRLLRDPAIAAEWRGRIDHVFVDEYQDINEAQDWIITALSRSDAGEEAESGNGNRFLVGDVKQSIYRFRQANPSIFGGYEQRWGGDGGGRRAPLTENFRSRAGLLDFINPLFASLMRREVGGVDYEPLKFGAPADRGPLAVHPGDPQRVEIHVIGRSDEDPLSEDSDDENAGNGQAGADLPSVEREARLVANRFRALKESGHQVWDEQEKGFRPVRWNDMTVLLRSPAGRAEAFAMEFEKAGIPLVAARDGFFESLEISDLLNLLKLLDNPLQDIPVLAVLRSPLCGLSLDELAEVRAHNSAKPFWTALAIFQNGIAESKGGNDGGNEVAGRAREKARRFFERFERWREIARHGSISKCLEAAMGETSYEAQLLAGTRGKERQMNVRRLLDLARQFDPYQRQGLYRFLKFVESQEEEDLDLQPSSPESSDAVRLMSIHKSKGLEFPVVALACMGTLFSERDLQKAVLISEGYGLCPRIVPPGSDQSYISLPYWLGRQRERRELRGEELRLLYVALTRARDTLILAGSSAKTPSAIRGDMSGVGPISTTEVVDARSHLEWVLMWLARAARDENWLDEFSGSNDSARWRFIDDRDPVFAAPVSIRTASVSPPANADDSRDVDRIRGYLDWCYPFATATTEAAKTSVSVLRRRVSDESAAEATEKFRIAKRRVKKAGGLSAAEIGSAHHLFLQFASAEKLGDEASARVEGNRLMERGVLTREQFQALDFAAIMAFWNSDLGRGIRANKESVHHEIPFTARFSRAELRRCGIDSDIPEDEFIVVQGFADLAVIRKEGIWVVDFKTDEVNVDGLAARAAMYTPQLKLYALALSRIYDAPVEKVVVYFLSQRQAVEL